MQAKPLVGLHAIWIGLHDTDECSQKILLGGVKVVDSVGAEGSKGVVVVVPVLTVVDPKNNRWLTYNFNPLTKRMCWGSVRS